LIAPKALLARRDDNRPGNQLDDNGFSTGLGGNGFSTGFDGNGLSTGLDSNARQSDVSAAAGQSGDAQPDLPGLSTRLDGAFDGGRSGGPDSGHGGSPNSGLGLNSPDNGLGHGTSSDTVSAHGADQTDPCYRSAASDGAGPWTSSGADPLSQAGVPPIPELPWMNWVGDIPTELAQRIACDCEVWRAILDPATGLPLEVGRAHRIVPHWIRKALRARDRGCRWPGCDAPAAWTDAHHLLDWYYGGETNIDNLLSLCRYHHARVHEGHWRIVLDHATGEVRVFRPDGTPYELGPSQPWTSPNTRRGERPPDAAPAKAA
jgi:hypothetical protein